MFFTRIEVSSICISLSTYYKYRFYNLFIKYFYKVYFYEKVLTISVFCIILIFYIYIYIYACILHNRKNIVD
jgi:hypothetical protein